MGLDNFQAGPPVWARKHVVLGTCPKSYITAESLSFLEEFSVERRLGRMDPERLTARQVEAFLVLENELAMEIKDGEQRARNAY